MLALFGLTPGIGVGGADANEVKKRSEAERFVKMAAVCKKNRDADGYARYVKRADTAHNEAQSLAVVRFNAAAILAQQQGHERERAKAEEAAVEAERAKHAVGTGKRQ